MNDTEWIVQNTVCNTINHLIIQEEECPVIKLASAKFIEGVTKAAQKDQYFCGGGGFSTGVKAYKLPGGAVPVPSVGAPINNPTVPRWIAMKFYWTFMLPRERILKF